MRFRIDFYIIPLLWPAILCAQGKILVLDFNANGIAVAKAEMVSQALRDRIEKDGGFVIPAQASKALMARRGISAADFLTHPQRLREAMVEMNAGGAVYGEITSVNGLINTEIAYLESDADNPVVYDPLVTGNIEGLISIIPDISRLVLSPDKASPGIISVEPPPGAVAVSQYTDVKITFSEPMNPQTFSFSGIPENLWRRYDEVSYDSSLNAFRIKVHLYPGIEYKFFINGAGSKGFKDLAGNPAPEYSWGFATSK